MSVCVVILWMNCTSKWLVTYAGWWALLTQPTYLQWEIDAYTGRGKVEGKSSFSNSFLHCNQYFDRDQDNHNVITTSLYRLFFINNVLHDGHIKSFCTLNIYEHRRTCTYRGFIYFTFVVNFSTTFKYYFMIFLTRKYKRTLFHIACLLKNVR